MSCPSYTIFPQPARLIDRLGRPRSQGLCLLVCLIALVVAAKAIVIDNLDLDCFWHLRVAEQLKTDGIGPLVDHLSFASIQSPWTPYSWLAELGMKWLWDWGGYRMAVLAGALMQAALVVGVAAICRTARAADCDRARFLPPAGALDDFDRRPPRMCAAAATAFATFISIPYLGFRPVTAALVVMTACCWLLVRDRRMGERSGLIWAIVPATVLTVNLHLYAAFIPVWVAALLAGSLLERWFVAEVAERHEAERRVVRYFVLLFASVAACMLTPMLPGILAVGLHYHFRDPMVSSGFIGEMRPFFRGPTGHVSGAIVAGALLCILVRRRRLRPGEQVWLVVSMILLSRLGRFAPVFALAAAPQLAVTLPRWSDVPLGKPILRLAMAGILAIGTCRLALQFPRRSVSIDAWLNRHGGFPGAAADFVRDRVPRTSGHLIAEFSWGGYLEWRLAGKYQVLLDGRTQLFTPEFWYATYLGGPEPRRRFLSEVQADAAILPARPGESRSVFRHALVQLGWTTAYRDDTSEVMVPPSQNVRTPDAAGKTWPFAGIKEMLNAEY